MQNIILQTKNIHKNYGKKAILNGVNLTIPKGKLIGMVGVNGAGKTTLIEIICGVKSCSEGEVIGLEDKVHKIGYMPQQFSLFSDLTVKENLQYFATLYNLSDDIVEQNLINCHLKEKENMLCKNLSGGYKQLVSLAAALQHAPELLIMDEPTSAMDPLFRDSFWNIIHNYNQKGGTIFLTTHYVEEIQECDILTILSKGKIVFDGPAQEVFNSKHKNIAEFISYYTKGDKYDK